MEQLIWRGLGACITRMAPTRSPTRFACARSRPSQREGYIPQSPKVRFLGTVHPFGEYLPQRLFEELFDRGLQLITTLRKNMKPKMLPLLDKLMLRKRSIIETINDQLKNISQIEHTRHRSLSGFLVNMLSGLVAYTHQPNRPAIKWAKNETLCLETKQDSPAIA